MKPLITERPSKPRTTGRTHIIDTGLGCHEIEGYLEIGAPYIDLVKLGWGTSVVTKNLEKKLSLYASYEIEVCLGGTLFEYFYQEKKVPDYIAWLKDLGLKSIEISDGVITFEPGEKAKFIEMCTPDFTVYSEVGSKDPTATVAPSLWIEEAKSDLNAGAQYVILEGRETASSGIYRNNGEIREGLLEEFSLNGIKQEQLIFETPTKNHQLYFLKKYGRDVNLANIPFNQAIGLETLRLGLRGDTLGYFSSSANKETEKYD